MWTGSWSLKVSSVSAGSTICLLPVIAPPAVPAPPPASAPIAAPLPPPASPPINAPSPAPPPANMRRTLAFARLSTLNRTRRDRIAAVARGDTLKLDNQFRPALEFTQRLGIDHCAVSARSACNGRITVNNNIVRHSRGKGVTRLRNLGAEILVKTHPNGCARRKFDSCGSARCRPGAAACGVRALLRIGCSLAAVALPEHRPEHRWSCRRSGVRLRSTRLRVACARLCVFDLQPLKTSTDESATRASGTNLRGRIHFTDSLGMVPGGGKWGWADSESLPIPPPLWLNIEILHVESVILNELPARLNIFAHKRGENGIGFCDVFELYSKKCTPLGVHCGFPKLR